MKKKILIGYISSVLIIFLMISTATAVNIINGVEANEISVKKESINVDQIEEKEFSEKQELFFNTLVDILNNKELRKNLENEFNIRSLKFYSYNDIENLYQKGLKMSKFLNTNKIKKRINNLVSKNYDLYQKISGFIKENDEIMNSIKDLSVDCEECNTYNSNGVLPTWFPGHLVICAILFLIAIPCSIPAFIGGILFEITGILGLGLQVPMIIVVGIAMEFGCIIAPF